MPIYEYECEKCGKIVEALQKFSDKPLTKCNHCSGKLHKLVSQSSFQLKGTGWYVTDYANKSKRQSSITNKNKCNASSKDSSTEISDANKSKKTSQKATAD